MPAWCLGCQPGALDASICPWCLPAGALDASVRCKHLERGPSPSIHEEGGSVRTSGVHTHPHTDAHSHARMIAGMQLRQACARAHVHTGEEQEEQPAKPKKQHPAEAGMCARTCTQVKRRKRSPRSPREGAQKKAKGQGHLQGGAGGHLQSRQRQICSSTLAGARAQGVWVDLKGASQSHEGREWVPKGFGWV